MKMLKNLISTLKIKLLSIWNLCVTKLFFIYNPYYQSIHSTPIYVWKELQKDNPDFSIMLKSNLNKRHLKKDSIGLGFEYYMILLSDYFREFGHAKNFKKILDLKLEIIDLNIKQVQTGDRFLLNIIELKKAQLKKLDLPEDTKSVKKDFNSEMSAVIKGANYPIDIKKFTIYQYYLQRLSLENG